MTQTSFNPEQLSDQQREHISKKLQVTSKRREAEALRSAACSELAKINEELFQLGMEVEVACCW